MKSLIIAALAAALALSAAPALAKTYNIPGDDAPVVKISIPDKWDTDGIDAGVESTSPDGSTYVAIEVIAADDAKAATQESMKVFSKDPSMKFDESSMKSEDINVGSSKGTDIRFTGSNKDGPQEFEITLIPLQTGGKFLLISFWGTPDGDKANKAQIDSIMGSLDFAK
jgi:hypothetical protein